MKKLWRDTCTCSNETLLMKAHRIALSCFFRHAGKPPRTPSVSSQLNDADSAINHDGHAVHDHLCRIERSIYQWDAELPSYDRCVCHQTTNLGHGSTRNAEERRPDRRRGIGHKHITRLEAVKVARSRDNPRGTTCTTRAARPAYEDASPIAFLRAAPKHHHG